MLIVHQRRWLTSFVVNSLMTNESNLYFECAVAHWTCVLVVAVGESGRWRTWSCLCWRFCLVWDTYIWIHSAFLCMLIPIQTRDLLGMYYAVFRWTNEYGASQYTTGEFQSIDFTTGEHYLWTRDFLSHLIFTTCEKEMVVNGQRLQGKIP